jgi:UDPglucose--hexose-1-phosphate uridylyltransferase
MPELRHDALSGRTVLVAPERATRPHSATAPPAPPTDGPDCPFCPGCEDQTPPEVARIGPGAPDSPGWRVRVVPNKYALVGGAVGGAHEVVVLSPAHDRDLRALDAEQAHLAMRTLRDRAAYHLAHGLVCAQPFINFGRAAGSSLEHPHAQLVALDFEPPAVCEEAARFSAAGVDLVAESREEARRREVVLVEGATCVWSPWAAATPYETLVAHEDAGDELARASNEQIDAVTDGLRDVLTRVHRLLGTVPYNIVFHSMPGGHWYARVTIRTYTHAGFEMGTGILANTVPSEIAAQRLRGEA